MKEGIKVLTQCYTILSTVLSHHSRLQKKVSVLIKDCWISSIVPWFISLVVYPEIIIRPWLPQNLLFAVSNLKINTKSHCPTVFKHLSLHYCEAGVHRINSFWRGRESVRVLSTIVYIDTHWSVGRQLSLQTDSSLFSAWKDSATSVATFPHDALLFGFCLERVPQILGTVKKGMRYSL